MNKTHMQPTYSDSEKKVRSAKESVTDGFCSIYAELGECKAAKSNMAIMKNNCVAYALFGIIIRRSCNKRHAHEDKVINR